MLHINIRPVLFRVAIFFMLVMSACTVSRRPVESQNQPSATDDFVPGGASAQTSYAEVRTESEDVEEQLEVASTDLKAATAAVKDQKVKRKLERLSRVLEQVKNNPEERQLTGQNSKTNRFVQKTLAKLSKKNDTSRVLEQQKTQESTSLTIAGAVIAIVGLVFLLAGSNATVGVVLLVVGLVLVLVGVL